MTNAKKTKIDKKKKLLANPYSVYIAVMMIGPTTIPMAWAVFRRALFVYLFSLKLLTIKAKLAFTVMPCERPESSCTPKL